MSAARARLVTALDATARSKVPDIAAHAQAMFDCWMEEQGENRQPEDIAACRAAFFEALSDVEAAVAPPVVRAMAVEPEPEPEPMPEPEPEFALPMIPSFFVFFDFDSSALDAKAQAAVDWAAGQILSREPSRVFVAGHTDTAGSAEYNQALSERRANAIAAALQVAGVDGAILVVTASGESELRVNTGDGVPERGNRYVQITLIP